MQYLEMISSEHDRSPLPAKIGSPGAEEVWGGGVSGWGQGPGPDGGNVTRGPGPGGHHGTRHWAWAAGGPGGARVGDDGAEAGHPELTQPRAWQHRLTKASQTRTQPCARGSNSLDRVPPVSPGSWSSDGTRGLWRSPRGLTMTSGKHCSVSSVSQVTIKHRGGPRTSLLLHKTWVAPESSFTSKWRPGFLCLTNRSAWPGPSLAPRSRVPCLPGPSLPPAPARSVSGPHPLTRDSQPGYAHTGEVVLFSQTSSSMTLSLQLTQPGWPGGLEWACGSFEFKRNKNLSSVGDFPFVDVNNKKDALTLSRTFLNNILDEVFIRLT